MTTGQKITMWIFGLLISAVLYLAGMTMSNDGNVFVTLGLPLIILGGMFFVSFSKKKGN